MAAMTKAADAPAVRTSSTAISADVGQSELETDEAIAASESLISKAKADVEALLAGSLDVALLLQKDKQIAAWLNENPVSYGKRQEGAPCQ
jgi:hypothetical protein